MRRCSLRPILSSSLFLLAAGTAGSVHAADTSTLGNLTLRPTIHAVGVTAVVSGDDDGDAAVKLAFRKAGDASFTSGHPLLRTSGGRRGSALFLEPATEYEVRVTLDDPDNGAPQEVTGTIRTRDDAPPPQGSKHLYVDAKNGTDGNDGSQGKPFKSIGAAASAAGPGTVVHVAAGVYRETVTVEGNHGGAAGNPVWFVAEPGAILDGSDPALEDGSVFQSEGNGIYAAPFSGASQYVAVDDVRLYDYGSLADLEAAAAGLAGGFYVDAAAGKIYLKLPDGGSPAGHTIHVAIRNVGILLDTVTDVVVEGFEIRHLGANAEGAGIDVRDTARAWVRKNHIHHMNAGIRVRRPLAAENVIEDNVVRDTSIWSWPWSSVKAHTPEASAIGITGGAGNVVRRNQLSGTFNGVYIGSFDDSSEAVAPDTDVYENVLAEHGDDGLEPEGACVNVRLWNNHMRGVLNGVSLAPIEVGPLFVVRNVIDGFKEHALKVNNGSQGFMLVYHTTSRPAAELAEAQAIAPTIPFANLITRNNIWASHRYVIESSITPSGPVDLDWDNLFTDILDGTPRFVKWLDVKYASIAELAGSGTIESHGFQVEPQYEDAEGGDFTPVEGSGLVDVGVVIEGINDRFVVGTAPDLGAFERGGVGPLPDGGLPDGGSGASSSGAGGSGGEGNGAGGNGDGAAGDEGGCGCRLGDGAAPGIGLYAFGALAWGLSRRRRGAKAKG
ncbi:right-handed parallel beta-helix repeat-containing protein [Polyangium sp. y55x31]|uniref:right-handed parallel beta-helix repeat-containing protein n=1 Tax=Polyangium sp. y55x31 TaxID=3042688 RepID=UPI0024832D3E|nr:right-handed parallel beta-helix repeat-containing protein [Polyangium sp. y55x31]MDI1479598.1 right-handed parallel beta-helix repeat-containing protein [Polyangium sp. y55x31]